MGNAVSPAVAGALGRCLAKAAAARSPAGEPVIKVVDPVLAAVSRTSFAGPLLTHKVLLENLSMKIRQEM